MKKVIKFLVIVAVLVGAAAAWFTNTGNIQSVVFRAKGRVKSEAKKMSRKTTPTDQGIQEAKQCRQMLERIQNAKRRAEERTGVSGATVTWAEVLPLMNMKSIPQCPSGGEYQLNPALQCPSCSIGGNGTVDPADDHIIYY